MHIAGLLQPLQELEQHWESRTVPELRRIVSEELGVSVDSWRIEYDPELDDHRFVSKRMADITISCRRRRCEFFPETNEPRNYLQDGTPSWIGMGRVR